MDPRRILEEAAQHRQTCQIQVRGERWIKGQVVRVERGGLVITSDERRFIGGEDLRVWLTFEMKQYTFQASVIRAGVPIPERNQDGLLLGFIDNWAESTSESNTKEGYVVELVPANGPAISLLDAPVRLVELVVDGLSFTVPDDFKLIFVESGTVTVRIQAPGIDSLNIHARVGALSAGEGYRLYGLEFEKVEDPENHRKVVEQLGQR